MADLLADLMKFRDDLGIGEMQRRTVRVEVHGGLCQLEFMPGICCGSANPGIGFELSATTSRMVGPTRDGRWRAGMGAISLTDARQLRDMLDWFIAKHESTNGG
jgi:hypothetical protein